MKKYAKFFLGGIILTIFGGIVLYFGLQYDNLYEGVSTLIEGIIIKMLGLKLLIIGLLLIIYGFFIEWAFQSLNS